MAADDWLIYNNAKQYIGDGTFDMDAGDAFFAVILVTSSYTPDLSHDTYSDVSGDEVANGNGYSTGGVTPSNTSWTETGGVATFDSDDPTWTANGGPITARYAVLVHVAAGSGAPQAGDKLIAYSLLDNSPADVIANDQADLIIVIDEDGYFDLSGGDT